MARGQAVGMQGQMTRPGIDRSPHAFTEKKVTDLKAGRLGMNTLPHSPVLRTSDFRED